MSREERNRYVRRSKYSRKKKKKTKAKKLPTPKSFIPSIKYEEVDDYFQNPQKFKINLSEIDEKKLLLGKEAWEQSLKFFHNPAIPSPLFIFDKSKFLGFFIDMNTWETVMNLSNSPQLILDKEILNYFRALSLHEISHYAVCPYDILTNARLIKAALRHVTERQTPIIVNLFADLLIDMKLFRQKPEIMEEEFRSSFKMNQKIGKSKTEKRHSKFYKILVKCYELMWDINLNLLETEYEDITPLAKRIKDIIMKDFEDFTSWEKKVTKIAGILKNIMMEDFQPSIESESQPGTGSGTTEWGEDFTAGDTDKFSNEIQIPLDVQATVGNPLEIKTKSKASDASDGRSGPSRGRGRRSRSKTDEEDKRDAEILAGEMNLGDFVRINRIMGLVPRTQAIATYYRGISKNLIKIKMLQRKPSGSIPIGIEPWRISDPIEKLDILQSLLVSPKIIPNITTRKWIMKDGPGIDSELGLPDLLLVLDSSGSMEWDPFSKRKKNKSPYHLALVASFASLNYALMKGAKVAAINFSDYFNVQSWTREIKKIEKILLNYQGMGTNLPTTEIKRQCQIADRKSIVFLITDFEIFNWGVAYPDILKILHMGNKIIGFFIGGNPSELNSPDFDELSTLGAKFYCVNNVDDLIGLVISEIKEVYEH